MIEALGPVNKALPHTIITISKQPTVLPWLRRVPLAVGTYVVNGDVRMYLGDRLSRRLGAAGVLKSRYVDPNAELIAAVKAEEAAHPKTPVVNQDVMDLIERAYHRPPDQPADDSAEAIPEPVKAVFIPQFTIISSTRFDAPTEPVVAEVTNLVNQDQIASGADVPHISITSMLEGSLVTDVQPGVEPIVAAADLLTDMAQAPETIAEPAQPKKRRKRKSALTETSAEVDEVPAKPEPETPPST